mmetsp:Transcript_4622/g.9915  ORF Transcript_4622/g.9915 Transcript_4622/m.9915 type:complete len:220 (+) Transcript_4622:69-728(+)
MHARRALLCGCLQPRSARASHIESVRRSGPLALPLGCFAGAAFRRRREHLALHGLHRHALLGVVHGGGRGAALLDRRLAAPAVGGALQAVHHADRPRHDLLDERKRGLLLAAQALRVTEAERVHVVLEAQSAARQAKLAHHALIRHEADRVHRHVRGDAALVLKAEARAVILEANEDVLAVERRVATDARTEHHLAAEVDFSLDLGRSCDLGSCGGHGY